MENYFGSFMYYLILSQEGKILSTNKKCDMLFGNKMNFIGSKFTDHITESDVEKFSLENEKIIELTFKDDKGSNFVSVIEILRVESPAGENFIVRFNENLKDANKRLITLNKELNKLNTTKDKLFSIIAHDLRNPIGAAISSVELLKDETSRMSAGEEKEMLEIQHRSLKQISCLIEDLTDWYLLTSDRKEFEFKSLSFFEIFDTVIERNLFRIMSVKKNIKLLFSVNDYQILVDENAIRLILRNLIANAIKFTPEHGHVKINVIQEKDFLKISIKDTGIGIEKEDLQKVFLVGQKESIPGTKGEKGTGLGLVLCKEFVDKMGGEIGVESDGLDKGSTFWFTVPLIK